MWEVLLFSGSIEKIWLLVVAMGLDLWLGDPSYPFHPVRIIGKWIGFVNSLFRKVNFYNRWSGILLVIFTVFPALTFYCIVNQFFANWKIVQWIWQLFILYSFLALGDLLFHARRVLKFVEDRDLEAVRRFTSYMVGRDVKHMDYQDAGRAVIESVAENLNDGVIAPLFFYLIGGIQGVIFFKCVSTLDSMVGYRYPPYQYFGWASARLDDLLNYIPARLSWLLIWITTLILPGYSSSSCWRIGWEQHNRLPSPNSGWPEAAFAGALSCRLVGPIYRKGVLAENFWLGPNDAPIGGHPQDIKRALVLARWTGILTTLLVSLFIGISW